MLFDCTSVLAGALSPVRLPESRLWGTEAHCKRQCRWLDPALHFGCILGAWKSRQVHLSRRLLSPSKNLTAPELLPQPPVSWLLQPRPGPPQVEPSDHYRSNQLQFSTLRGADQVHESIALSILSDQESLSQQMLSSWLLHFAR